MDSSILARALEKSTENENDTESPIVSITLTQCHADINNYLLHCFMQKNLEQSITSTCANTKCYVFLSEQLQMLRQQHSSVVEWLIKYFETRVIINFDILSMAEVFVNSYAKYNKIDMSSISFIEYLRAYMYHGRNFCRVIRDCATEFLLNLPKLTDAQISLIKNQINVSETLRSITNVMLLQEKIENDLNVPSNQSVIRSSDNAAVPRNNNANAKNVPNKESRKRKPSIEGDLSLQSSTASECDNELSTLESELQEVGLNLIKLY